MESLRERLLQAALARLVPALTALGAQVLRAPTTPVLREMAPALLLFPETEHIAQRANDRIERNLIVRVVALARDSGGEAAAVIADRLLTAGHAALFTDPNLGGLCLGIQELDCDWEAEDADANVAALPARYQISYRTLVHDLTVQG